jgi:hypothetical protein
MQSNFEANRTGEAAFFQLIAPTAYLSFRPFVCPRRTAIPPSTFFARNAISFVTESFNCLVKILALSFFKVHLAKRGNFLSAKTFLFLH